MTDTLFSINYNIYITVFNATFILLSFMYTLRHVSAHYAIIRYHIVFAKTAPLYFNCLFLCKPDVGCRF
jgi:hypothetical protein